MKGGIEGCIQGCPLEGDGEVDASENETKFGRQVGGRETINYGGVVGGVGRMLNARLRLVTRGVGAPRQLWIKRAAWPQPLVPASNGRHRVSPRATWQRAICYFALSATRSLINLAALFAGRSACFIPRSGRHIPPDSLHPFSHPLSLFPLPFSSREFDRSTRIRRRSKKEKMDTAKWIGAVSIALKFLSVCRDFLNKKKRRRTEFFIRDWRTFDGYTSCVNNLVFLEIYHVTCSNYWRIRYIFLSFIESHGQQTNESEDTSWNTKRYHRTRRKKGKKQFTSNFSISWRNIQSSQMLILLAFFFARKNHLFSPRFPPKTLSSVEHVRYYSIWKRRLIKDGYVPSNLISLVGNAYLSLRRFQHF